MENKECTMCGGSGQEVVGENYVTEDMAIDAGDRSKAGMFHSYAYGPCSRCDGTGIEPETPEKPVFKHMSDVSDLPF